MATEGTSSEIIERQRTKLLNVLQQDPDSFLDTLTSRRLISEEEYETLEEITDPLKKSRKLLILVQKKGEDSCCCFLKCLSNAFPELAATLAFKYGAPQQGTEAARPAGVSLDSEYAAEKAETAATSEEEATPEFFTYEESNSKEPAVYSGEKEEGRGSPQVTEPHSVERAEYEVPASITYLHDGQRYEEPDDSLYLGEGEYQESVGYPEDVETTVEEGAFDGLQCYVCDDEEECEYEETTGFSDEESCEASETGVSLEEEEKSTEGMETVREKSGNLINRLRRCRGILQRGNERANQLIRNLVFLYHGVALRAAIEQMSS
ncbi:caspase recruitment domain-containing protein 6 [Psammomys obesus]|uniref:caspase recruitment domain-containing protein 6 n=1 Tax=Psammomys obesus TaxID=48139 RepID=UPI0024529C47|nr:caspase recruitment domain-containing protein 6 [Psammomys obesus]